MRALVGCCLALLLSAPSMAAPRGQAFFDDNCAACHTIGGEPGAGPDLKDILKRRDRAWLVRFIRDPHEAAAADADAAALLTQYDDMMPATEGASPETIDAVLRYIEAKGAGEPAAAEAAVAPAVTTEDIERGHDLYSGERALAGGGPACVACHRVAGTGTSGGGALGPDLTEVRRRLGGTRGLAAWLSNPPTPMMRAVYGQRPLDAPDARALAAFLGEPAGAGTGAARSPTLAFVAIGAAGLLAVLALMGAAWSGRFRSVRRPMVSAARTRAHAGGRR